MPMAMRPFSGQLAPCAPCPLHSTGSGFPGDRRRREERGKESLTQQSAFEPSASLKYDTLLTDKQPIRIVSGCTPCQ